MKVQKVLFKKFEELLISLLNQLLDPTQAFIQTEDTDRCQYCDLQGNL